MATITTRNTKGSALTFTELDANFTNLNNAKYEAGANPSFGAITASGAYIGTTCTLSGAASVAGLASSGAITGTSITSSALVTATSFRNTSKTVITTTLLAAATLASQFTYFTGASVNSSFALTFPAANTPNLDGQIYTVMSTVTRLNVTWISTGATFIGAPASLSATIPIRFQFHLATNQWLSC